MSLESRINQLINKAAAREQINPELDVKIAALEAEMKAMSDEELRAAITDGYGNANNEFSVLSDRQLWEIIAREES